MMLEIIVFLFLGVLFGVITGITPGVHINLVAVLLLSLSPFLLTYVHILSLICFIMSMSITHTFLDFLPSIYLGAPSDETALAVLPGHKFLLAGMAYEAVRLSVIGSFFGILLTLLFSPLLFFLVPRVFSFLQPFMAYILLTILAFLVFKSGDKNCIFWSFVITLIAGMLGFLTFQLHLSDPLFPLFSGLFGVSVLLTSIFEKVTLPKQRITEQYPVALKKTARASCAGVFSGCFVSLFPGLGPSQAALVGSAFVDNQDDSYLLLTGAIGSSSMLFSIITLFSIDKARNGVIVVLSYFVSNHSLPLVLFLFITAFVAAGVSVWITFYLAKKFSQVINFINYRWLCISIILFIILLVFFFTGWKGFLVLCVSACVGLLPQFLGIGRHHLMSCVIASVIIYAL